MSAGGVIRCVNKTGKSLLSSATAAATKHHGCTPAAASPASVAYSAYSAAESTAARVTSPAGHGGGLGGNQGTAVAFESSSSTSGGYHGSKDEETKPTNTNDVYKSGKADSLGGPGAGGLGAGGSGTRAIVSPLSGVRTVSPLSAVPLSGNSAGRPAGVGVHTTTAPALSPSRVDAVVIGAGQAGLSAAYYLQRAGGLRFVTLDANQEPGGAWRHRWPSLELFSTRRWSSLPGYPMFANGSCEDGYPSTGEMAMYMEEYEQVMKLNVVRPVTVTGVTRTTMGTFLVDTDCLLGGAPARWEARTVISAAGSHNAPDWPRLPGAETFRGMQLHSSQYRCAEAFRGARVAVVGSGNSGAQILAEVSRPGIAASTLWSTAEKPTFLPTGLSGKDIFDTVARLRQQQGFVREEDIPSLHSVIMQPSVMEAAERGVYDYRVPAFTHLTPTGVAWDGEEAEADVIIWCTGYRANTSHLSRLGVVREDSTVAMDPRDVGETDVPGVFAVGYGNWAGVGSGSIPGAAFYAKRAVTAAVNHLRGRNAYTPFVGKTSARQGDQSYQYRQRELLLPFGASSAHAMTMSGSWPVAGRSSATASGSSTRAAGDVAGTSSINGGASVVPVMPTAGQTRETAKVTGVEVEEDHVAVAA